MGNKAQYRLPFEPSTAGAARSRLGGFLSERRVDQVVIDNALVVMGELVANAVRHGEPGPGGTVGVEWYVQDGLHLIVRDGGRTIRRPVLQSRDVDALDGRGLAIVDALADGWKVESGTETTVHACLSLSD